LIAGLVAIGIWLAALRLVDVDRASSVVLGLFAALAFTYAFPPLAAASHRPVRRLIEWQSIAQRRLYPEPKDRASRLTESRLRDLMVTYPMTAEMWADLREIASRLTPRPREENCLALADYGQSGELDSARLSSAIDELADPTERAYWTVRLAMLKAFVEFERGGDYLQPLRDLALSMNAPLGLRGRIVFELRWFAVSVVYLGIGLLLAIVIRIAWNA
jgi:hypothetical protein